MKSRLILTCLASVFLTTGCALKKTHTVDLSYGTRVYGHVEVVASDFIVVRFTKIEAFGYSLDESERKLNLLKLYPCELFLGYCNYRIGQEVVAEARGGKRMKDPIGYEINYLQYADENDVPLIREFRGLGFKD